ncbi:MAG TPA: rhodanese-like domain-containing protein [Albitalea sp.]
MNPHPALAPVRRRTVLGRIAASAFAALAGSPALASPDAVSLETARADLEAGRAVLVDIREPDEHARGVAPGARLLPMRQLAARLGEIPTDPRKPVLLICHTQNRSRATLTALRERGGYGHVRYVEGGMSEWGRRGWPLVRPSR